MVAVRWLKFMLQFALERRIVFCFPTLHAICHRKTPAMFRKRSIVCLLPTFLPRCAIVRLTCAIPGLFSEYSPTLRRKNYETHIAPLHCGGILTETAAAITLNLGSRKQTRLTNSCWRILRIEEILQPKVPGENSTTQDIRRAPDIETAIVILHPLAFTHESLESPKAGTLPVDDQTWDTSFRKVEGLPSECFVPRLPSALRSVASISFGTL
jgi:hypothetical protein